MDTDPAFPNEASIVASNGATLRFSAYPDPVSYVRVISSGGEEIAYWTVDEITEDASNVLGAIFGAVMGNKKI